MSSPYGMTPLVPALYNRQFDSAVQLVERGANIDQWARRAPSNSYSRSDALHISSNQH
jgi:ankyrin repeat protein